MRRRRVAGAELTRATAIPVVDEVLAAAPDPLVYICRCRGFTSHRIEEMCLRCLDAYAYGIQLLLSPNRLQREMQRIAKVLMRELKSSQRVTVGDALRAADRGLSETRSST